MLWLATVWVRKGIQYLAEAARCLSREAVEFTVVRRIRIGRQAVASAPPNVRWLGLPLGVLKSLRWCLYTRRNAGAKMVGVSQGVRDTFRYWKSRRPVPRRRFAEWMRFRRKQARA